MIQRTVNHSETDPLKAYASWRTVKPVEGCTIDSGLKNAEVYTNSLCPVDNDITLQGVFESELFHMYEVDFTTCSNTSVELGSAEAADDPQNSTWHRFKNQ
jgi:hypothetical protein